MTLHDAVIAKLRARLDPGSNVPVYVQLGEGVREMIGQGELHPGDALPTVRALALALNLAPNTVARTFTALRRDGLTENRAGAGTTVAASAWVGRLDQERALRDLRRRLDALLGAGLTPGQLLDVLEGAISAHESGPPDTPQASP